MCWLSRVRLMCGQALPASSKHTHSMPSEKESFNLGRPQKKKKVGSASRPERAPRVRASTTG